MKPSVGFSWGRERAPVLMPSSWLLAGSQPVKERVECGRGKVDHLGFRSEVDDIAVLELTAFVGHEFRVVDERPVRGAEIGEGTDLGPDVHVEVRVGSRNKLVVQDDIAMGRTSDGDGVRVVE
jgi:hypothetical protein